MLSKGRGFDSKPDFRISTKICSLMVFNMVYVSYFDNSLAEFRGSSCRWSSRLCTLGLYWGWLLSWLSISVSGWDLGLHLWDVYHHRSILTGFPFPFSTCSLHAQLTVSRPRGHPFQWSSMSAYATQYRFFEGNLGMNAIASLCVCFQPGPLKC